ncbi:GerAB/ArcD/ProY family transporter [Paenibacillus glycinis]|uniref:GerAB/ArcD/ProY family transporter n=1 Tax=Paenibacillus glycinis TaxID=2697035 RepID=A0ABW9XW07_9BACL|nr:GerAB/ArcD/ProY family transporter [Paenibacillus glycinis]NBD26888.1 GerAB/ArcD/ProY family transporter [Paenibacillus glycinis]
MTEAAGRERYTISSIHLLCVMYVSIVDVSLMGFQREVVNDAGYDAWMSVLLAGLGVHLLLRLIFGIVSRYEPSNATIVAINNFCFGRAVGSVLNAAFMAFALLGAFLTYRSYLEMCKLWIFPTMNFWPFSLLFLVLLYYAVNGGLQAVAGICFWGLLSSLLFVAPFSMMLIPYLHPVNLMPAFDHSFAEVMRSSKQMAAQYIGFEVLLVAYPLLQHPSSSRKWAHAGVLLSTCMFLWLLLAAFMYFSRGQILHTIWPTLNMISVLEIPLMQRLEYLILSIWLIKILANISLGLWAVCHSAKLAFRAKPRIVLVVCLLLFAVLQGAIKDLNDIQPIRTLYNQVGLWFLYAFIPLLFVLTWLRRRKRISPLKYT